MNKIGKTLKIVLIIGILIGIPVAGISPFLLQHTSKTIYSMFIIYPNSLLMIGITYQFIKLFGYLEKNDPFTYNTVKTLKVTGILSSLMSLLWLIDLFFMIFVIGNKYINYIIVLIFLAVLFFGVSIALYILSELFRQATDYKEENDLTI